jgi:hypothetical protein
MTGRQPFIVKGGNLLDGRAGDLEHPPEGHGEPQIIELHDLYDKEPLEGLMKPRLEAWGQRGRPAVLKIHDLDGEMQGPSLWEILADYTQQDIPQSLPELLEILGRMHQDLIIRHKIPPARWNKIKKYIAKAFLEAVNNQQFGPRNMGMVRAFGRNEFQKELGSRIEVLKEGTFAKTITVGQLMVLFDIKGHYEEALLEVFGVGLEAAIESAYADEREKQKKDHFIWGCLFSNEVWRRSIDKRSPEGSFGDHFKFRLKDAFKKDLETYLTRTIGGQHDLPQTRNSLDLSPFLEKIASQSGYPDLTAWLSDQLARCASKLRMQEEAEKFQTTLVEGAHGLRDQAWAGMSAECMGLFENEILVEIKNPEALKKVLKDFATTMSGRKIVTL